MRGSSLVSISSLALEEGFAFGDFDLRGSGYPEREIGTSSVLIFGLTSSALGPSVRRVGMGFGFGVFGTLAFSDTRLTTSRFSLRVRAVLSSSSPSVGPPQRHASGKSDLTTFSFDPIWSFGLLGMLASSELISSHRYLEFGVRHKPT